MLQYRERSGETRELIGTLTYQSRAAVQPSEADLDRLVQRAQQRNRSLGITGMLLYEDGRYLQTLEGPREGLEAVWSAIENDERHDHIEILSQHYVNDRLFSDWDLLFYRKLEHAPKSMLERIKGPGPLAKHVPKVVRYALDANEPSLNELFARLSEKGWDGDDIARQLLEPAARAMGDAWLADECSEFDLTLGLGMLQMAGHAVRYRSDPDELRGSRYTILLASAPGESHLVGPSLLADQFTDAGWGVELVFPTSNEALQNQLNKQQPDAVDIALSDSLSRQGKVSQLRETVEQSRWSVSEHPLVVSVGGRLFAEASATAENVGADHARKSIAGTRMSIRELVERARSQGKLPPE